MQKHLVSRSVPSNLYILNSLMKYVRKNSELKSLVIPSFEMFLESWDAEIQQRAIEYIILCKNDGEDENMPNAGETR
jgi:hypothetical protein